MKVNFQYGLAGYTGKADGLVFCYDRSSGIVYARKRVYPRLTAENHRIGNISRNIFALKPAEEYKDDLRLYLMRYNGLVVKSQTSTLLGKFISSLNGKYG